MSESWIAKPTGYFDNEIERFMHGLIRRNEGEVVFHQAVREFAESVIPFLSEHQLYRDQYILERMTEPDRIIIFRVTWEDDQGHLRANRAWRVQFNNSIGPYKGGLRFHPSVDQSILKFLGFEQVFKNSLTGLPMGGAKGGSNFNPKGKSDREVMRFCHSLMIELHRHIGPDRDIPAGDIGVGAREISYLFGQYKRLENRWHGALTGKGLSYGGSLVRKEATGYGAVYFVQNMLEHAGIDLAGKKASVSGSGNVALYAIEKLLDLGATVHTASDSGGTIYDRDGIDRDKLAWLIDLKEKRRGRISEYAEQFGAEYRAGENPWSVPCDIALPCATQNELDLNDAKELVKNGLLAISEGANMPTSAEAMHYFLEKDVLFGPAKAANAGGVAVSGLEQSQNSLRISWSREELEGRLQGIMKEIHDKCIVHGQRPGRSVDYKTGANVAGFIKVADAMCGYGAV
ncbi:NADP-specific glutamate dehydrogenase [Persicirhabdus sediminis]|uniref:Glutamate dehydrogenase n=1 Tax=Persicirhabdus sediminis TaxID=454144 RepID=A0A8J7MEN8_9BACT|nr:NADP-specific glutamate dehydrogenase [Persicirhabdus sediminis]MBK1792549.1 NADP-specific glutamate dehydrogenase [Persicirhabdus sediminis]